MKIESIESLWEKDSKIDSVDLKGESLKIPQLHEKYFKILNQEVLSLKYIESQLTIVRKKKWAYYTGISIDENNNEVLIFYRGNEKEICCMFNLSQREIAIDNTYGKIIPFLTSQQVRQDSKKLNLSSYGFCFLTKTDFKV